MLELDPFLYEKRLGFTLLCLGPLLTSYYLSSSSGLEEDFFPPLLLLPDWLLSID